MSNNYDQEIDIPWIGEEPCFNEWVSKQSTKILMEAERLYREEIQYHAKNISQLKNLSDLENLIDFGSNCHCIFELEKLLIEVTKALYKRLDKSNVIQLHPYNP